MGISAQATQGEIQKAYRELMKQYHPDKLGAQARPNQPGQNQLWQDAQKIAEAINRAKDEMMKKAKS